VRCQQPVGLPIGVGWIPLTAIVSRVTHHGRPDRIKLDVAVTGEDVVVGLCEAGTEPALPLFFELDWNQQEFKLVGTPVVRNSLSKLGAIAPVSKCPPPRVEGPFELMTLQAIKADSPMSYSGIVTLETSRDQPAGAIPTINEFGCKEWIAVTAKSEAVLINFQLPPAMSLAMPGGAPYTLSPDGKSLIFKADGWVWTCTPKG